MVRWTAVIKRFDKQGEKTGWTYIDVPAAIATQLSPHHKRGFRVKGRIDDHAFAMCALLPVGGGDFILTLNATMRKGIKKGKDASVKIEMGLDGTAYKQPAALMECLEDEPAALAYLESLAPSHQNYFGKWIDSAKTETTKAKRIAATVNALLRKWDYGQMIRAQRDEKI